MVRVFKSRSLASEACHKGKVQINGNEAKASKELKVGDRITVRKSPVNHQFVCKNFPTSRVGAKLLPHYMEDITPPEEMQKLEPGYLAFQGFRKRGEGRPTKKERRTLDQALGGDLTE